ncbi:MAG: alpha/beta hydrolase [Spirochaetota bacterium]
MEWILFIAGILLLIMVVVLPVIITVMMNRRPGRSYLDSYYITPFELQVPFENICFTTTDDVTLRGWWMNGSTGSVVIGCSGRDGTKADLIGIGTAIWRSGHSVLLFDCRDRGESDSAPRTLGYSEQLDVEAATRYAKGRMPGAPMGMLGFSMGAALAIMAAAGNGHIRAVVADSPYASLYELVRDRLRSSRIPAAPVMPVVNLFNRLLYGYNLHDVNPSRDVKKISPRPILLIHGELDSVIPVSSVQQVYRKAGDPKELWISQKADHCGTYFMDRQAYMERVAGFFTRHLVSSSPST